MENDNISTVAGEPERIRDGVTVTMTQEQAETIHNWLQYGVDYHKCKKIEMEYCKDKKMRQELVAQHETVLTKTYDALKVIAATLGITVF